MSLTTCEAQFIQIMPYAVCGEALPLDIKKNIVDWSGIFTLAIQQNILPIIFETVYTHDDDSMNPKLLVACKQQVIRQVTSQIEKSEEFDALYKYLLEAGLHPIVVKGQLCSRLYPMPDHRLSGDDDLFISEEEFTACHKAILEYGLATDCPINELERESEISYSKLNSSLYIELHKKLFTIDDNEINVFFNDSFEHVVDIGGYLSLDPHRHLLYLILHAYKHFIRGGVGIRQVCDIGFWIREYSAEIDCQLLYKQFSLVHAETYAAVIFEIAKSSLGFDFELKQPWEKSSVEIEPMLHDILCGGAYGMVNGTRIHTSTVTLNAVHSNRMGGKHTVLNSIFPNKSYMELSYPYLKKASMFLPIAWGQRIFQYAREIMNNESNNAFDSMKLAEERIKLLKMYGIIDK
jgi:hypothetical protein